MIEIGPNVVIAIKIIFGCITIIAFFRYVIGEK